MKNPSLRNEEKRKRDEEKKKIEEEKKRLEEEKQREEEEKRRKEEKVKSHFVNYFIKKENSSSQNSEKAIKVLISLGSKMKNIIN